MSFHILPSLMACLHQMILQMHPSQNNRIAIHYLVLLIYNGTGIPWVNQPVFDLFMQLAIAQHSRLFIYSNK